jgi:hypothetical protein
MVITYDAEDSICTMYVDGQQVDSVPAPVPLSMLNDENNWLGRAQWSPDGMFDGRFNEFRIYSGIMTPDEVAQNLAFGADNLPAIGGVTVSATDAIVTWQEHPLNTGFEVDTAAALGEGTTTVWTPSGVAVSGDLSNRTATIPLSGSTESYYRLAK